MLCAQWASLPWPWTRPSYGVWTSWQGRNPGTAALHEETAVSWHSGYSYYTLGPFKWYCGSCLSGCSCHSNCHSYRSRYIDKSTSTAVTGTSGTDAVYAVGSIGTYWTTAYWCLLLLSLLGGRCSPVSCWWGAGPSWPAYPPTSSPSSIVRYRLVNS